MDKRLKCSVALLEMCGGDDWLERRFQGGL
jgi:hypothetical protein